MAIQKNRLKNVLQTIKYRLQKNPRVQFMLRTLDGAGNHDATHLAAGVAYYALLSIFPLLLGLIAVLGFFLPSANLQDTLLKFVGDSVPGAAGTLQQNIDSIIQLRGPVGIISVVILFWGASAVFSALSLAINRAWDIKRYHRHFFIRKASELGMVIAIGFLLLLSLGASSVISIMRGVFNSPEADLLLLDIGSRVAAFLLIMAVFLLIYKFVPNTKTYWSDIWPGALLAAVFFEIARTLFVIYLENFANYQILYGSVASIMILLVWIYYCAFIVILGAEFSYRYTLVRHPHAIKTELINQ
jgi:membrane protein